MQLRFAIRVNCPNQFKFTNWRNNFIFFRNFYIIIMITIKNMRTIGYFK